jgi:hypothetical protein
MWLDVLQGLIGCTVIRKELHFLVYVIKVGIIRVAEQAMWKDFNLLTHLNKY